MIHVHRSQCESTQKLAIELSKQHSEEVLVSCEEQISGEGQRGKEWHSADQAIAISFTTWPSDIYSLSSLEMAVLTRQFLLKKFNVSTQFKWPNDLFNMDRKKCGGILIQNSGDRLVVGIGINIYQGDIPSELTQMGSLFNSPQRVDIETVSKELRNYIMDNRMPSNTILSQWEKHCLHLKEEIEVIESNGKYRAKFKGVGEYGQAIVELDGKNTELFSASLVIDPR